MEKDFWKKQVDEFCEIFGFHIEIKPNDGILDDFKYFVRIKYGRSVVAYKDVKRTWCSGELPLEVNIEDRAEDSVERAMEEIMKKASGKELIVRSSDKDRKTPYGFTKVRLIRHIKLPEFGSVEELKIELAVKGE